MGALIYAGQSLAQSNANATAQNRITESGQITDRFNAAVTNLSSDSETIRIGGVYALQRIMTDSPFDQPAVMQVLAAFIREHAPPTSPSTTQATAVAWALQQPAIDVQTALTVLVTRDLNHDRGAIVDLESADLAGASLSNADLSGADLAGANLYNADLTNAGLDRANLTDASLVIAHLNSAGLGSANLNGADLVKAILIDTSLVGAHLSHAQLAGADLNGAHLGGADLSHAKLTRTDLSSAKLASTDLGNVNLRNAVLTDAVLSGL